MAGQNHQRTTLYNIMILSCHDSVSLGCGWPRCEISQPKIPDPISFQITLYVIYGKLVSPLEKVTV